MKRILLLVLVTILLANCKKQDNLPIEKPIKGKVTSRGTPTGVTVSKTIGNNGGTISIADSMVTVVVPAGAVDDNTIFSIQPITNNTPNGIGAAYRLLPEGIHFKKSVTLRLRYNDSLTTGTAPEVLYPSYQDSSGVWQAITTLVLDKSSKTISVQSNHFSDWSIFASYSLLAEKSVIATNETDELKAVEVFSLSDLSGSEVPVSEPITSAKVSNWRISYGKGSLISSETVASYQAPSTVPQENPVIISVDLRNIKTSQGSNGFMILTTSILIRDEFMEISLGGAVSKFGYCRVFSPAGKMQIVGGVNAGSWTGIIEVAGNAVAEYPFSPPQQVGGNKASVAMGSSYVSSYSTCQPSESHATQGAITITKTATAVGQYVEGTVSGMLSHQDGCNHIDKPVLIHFRAKREI